MTFLFLQHADDDPPMLVGQWLGETGAAVEVLRLHDGDQVPSSLQRYDGLVVLGGEMGAGDDDVAPWLPGVRQLLATAVAERVPTLGICLGAQLLAAATGGTVRPGAEGPEIGAYLTAKRDAAQDDPLFAGLPMMPDVMHYHFDVVDVLPPGAVLLLSSAGCPHQAFRVGSAAWGLQFHIEAPAEVVRGWASADGVPLTGRLGPALDEAEQLMGVVWRDFVHRFAALARNREAALPGRRLPLSTSEQ